MRPVWRQVMAYSMNCIHEINEITGMPEQKSIEKPAKITITPITNQSTPVRRYQVLGG